MKKVLFVLGEYQNKNSQNGLCVDFIMQEMQRDGFVCHVLSVEKKQQEFSYKQDMGVFSLFYDEPISGFKNKIRQIRKYFNMPLGNYGLVKRIFRKIACLYDENKYDAVIAVVNPTEAAEAVYWFKDRKKNVNCILYEIDPASNRYKYPSGLIEKKWKKKSTLWEIKIYSKFDSVVHMISHKKHFEERCYDRFIAKTKYSDIPSLRVLNYQKHPVNSPLIAVYAGAFYPELREPDYLINLVEELNQKINVKLMIFTGNVMRNKLIRLCEQKSNIELRDFVSQNELDKIIENSDLLFSIGNKDSDFLPSKVLYYIGSGKKVVHIYSDDFDISNSYFMRYGNSVLIDNRKSIESNVDKVLNFLLANNENEHKTSNLLDEFYMNTPVYTTKLFEDLVNEK